MFRTKLVQINQIKMQMDNESIIDFYGQYACPDKVKHCMKSYDMLSVVNQPFFSLIPTLYLPAKTPLSPAPTTNLGSSISVTTTTTTTTTTTIMMMMMMTTSVPPVALAKLPQKQCPIFIWDITSNTKQWHEVVCDAVNETKYWITVTSTP